MLSKAVLFGDESAFRGICSSGIPRRIRTLGRNVKGFDQVVWDRVIQVVAFEAVRQKFGQVPGLRRILSGTGDKVSVEASPQDQVWGVGLAV